MKKIIAFILMFSALALSAKTTDIHANIQTDSPDKIIKNENGKRFGMTATFDLSKIKGEIKSARMAVGGEVLDSDAPINPSLTFAIDGKETAAITQPMTGKFETMLVFSKQLNDAIAAGKNRLVVNIYMKGSHGAQRQISPQYAKLVVATDTDKYDFDKSMLPIFSSKTMYEESVFPLKSKDGSDAKAQLYFKPSKIIEACTYADGQKKILKEGTDFKIVDETIIFPEDSNAKIFKYDAIYSKTKSDADKLGTSMFLKEINMHVYFREGDWYHKQLIYVSYAHEDSSAFKYAKFDKKVLPKTVAKLRAGKPLKISIFGDSIAYGGNATARYDCPPFTPTWGELVTEKLRRAYPKSDIVSLNRSFGGTISKWGAKCIDELVVVDNPDLVIIAFGMNDRYSAAERKVYLKQMMDKVLAKNPDAEFIIVSSMSANPLWNALDVHEEYAKSDKTLASPSVAIADVRAAHKELLSKKRFIDMTGNNINHPNDFLIRIYAQAIASLLVDERK